MSKRYFLCTKTRPFGALIKGKAYYTEEDDLSTIEHFRDTGHKLKEISKKEYEKNRLERALK